MSDSSTVDAGGGEKKTKRSGLWLLLLLLLFAVVGVAYYMMTRPSGPPPDGAFRADFKGCDNAGLCADFTIYAPGRDYAWRYDRAIPADLPAGMTPLVDKVTDDLRDSEVVVVAGLASQEAGEDFNRWLSACRARAFEGLVVDAQASAGGSATVYRVSLGRYSGDPTVTTATLASGGEQTRIQRVMVLAFVNNIEQGVDLGEALKNGAEENLPAALALAAPDVAAQLQFSNYSCWGDEFELTPIGGRARKCFAEPTDNFAALCQAFTR